MGGRETLARVINGLVEKLGDKGRGYGVEGVERTELGDNGLTSSADLRGVDFVVEFAPFLALSLNFLSLEGKVEADL